MGSPILGSSNLPIIGTNMLEKKGEKKQKDIKLYL